MTASRPLVLDTGAVIGRLMPDERWPDIEPAMTDTTDLRVPWLFWVELRNVRIMQERRGCLPHHAAERLLTAVEQLTLRYDTSPDSAAALRLSGDFCLSVYDTLYLELALRSKAALFTTGHARAAAARTCGLTVLP